ncbi:MAG TPA: hypothetical protein VM452_00395 [Caulifigura sp.]|nr:hypothetical protein [Caulifigura sp.]
MKTWLLTGLCSLLLARGGVAADWKAPEKPDPQVILNEARDDRRAGRFDDALAKHIWYHRNALKYQPGHYGVRLSFALSDWQELAGQFMPAMVALKEERELAKANVLQGKDAFPAFHEYVAFNRVLDDEAATKTLFADVEKQRPADAGKIYRLVEPALIRSKDYQTCGKYLKPKQDYELLLLSFRLRSDARFAAHRAHLEESFTKGSATLVGLLVLNERRDEATEFAHEARREWDNAGHRKAIDDALAGKLPEPQG